jgi:hypothetical protein
MLCCEPHHAAAFSLMFGLAVRMLRQRDLSTLACALVNSSDDFDLHPKHRVRADGIRSRCFAAVDPARYRLGKTGRDDEVNLRVRFHHPTEDACEPSLVRPRCVFIGADRALGERRIAVRSACAVDAEVRVARKQCGPFDHEGRSWVDGRVRVGSFPDRRAAATQ